MKNDQGATAAGGRRLELCDEREDEDIGRLVSQSAISVVVVELETVEPQSAVEISRSLEDQLGIGPHAGTAPAARTVLGGPVLLVGAVGPIALVDGRSGNEGFVLAFEFILDTSGKP